MSRSRPRPGPAIHNVGVGQSFRLRQMQHEKPQLRTMPGWRRRPQKPRMHFAYWLLTCYNTHSLLRVSVSVRTSSSCDTVCYC